MTHDSLDSFLKTARAELRRGPVALIFVEDEVEIASTLQHHLQMGFGAVVVFMPQRMALPEDLAQQIHRVSYDATAQGAVRSAVDAVSAAAPGAWIYYCYNAEYLFFPFCETRTVGELLAFHSEERRDAMLSYVIDLYADDLSAHPHAVSREHAFLDRSGYYALARKDTAQDGAPKERQLDFFGGLRWRFEEYVPATRRRIDRIALFRAKPGLKMQEDHRFSDEEYNTFACPWHHNITAAICSFRAAKALTRNPGSREAIQTFKWHNSAPFEWQSRQLLDLGLMEPGQWF
ncbi:hypothetical protein So717_30820 [Roseobacter cerasinus]|uniref:Uncharacterized protein n=1 Tax=Roseobacter cerasinus TaxID=2602289 RepID=A0A640VTH5_9RHOB|nr:glycosyltransferase family 2 protein [Roseobacter cerasinus]GFE51329.1 hypothetical protein So717_30820 [Roseobacter cerasinus]